MKKIAIITNIMAPYRVDFFNYLSKNYYYDINVIYSAQNEDNRKWKINEIEHNYTILKSKTIKINKGYDYKYIHLPKNIINTLNNINPDIIIGSEYNPTVILAFLWAKFRNKKYISWSDGTLNSERNINILQKIFRRIICKNANTLIASSTKTKEAQEFYGAKKNIFISYLTVDVDKYKLKNKIIKNKKIICVASLIERKGIDLLFDALIHINSEYELILVGDGNKKESLRELAIKKGISDKVKFMGFKNNEEIKKLYKESDLFILPTREDCFGLVIIEAMCAGLPVIVSKFADGAYDLIADGINGFIIDPYKSDEFAKKIELLLSDVDLMKKMSIENYKKIEKFSLENVSNEYVKAIEYALK